jgi:general secretion pathway protein J
MILAPSLQRGFTLIEVLIALALMALLSILSWQALDVTARSSENLNASAEDTLALLRTLGQLETDIRRHAGDDVLLGEAARARSGVKLPGGIYWNEASLTIIRSAQEGTWKHVSWHMDEGELRRAEGAPGQVFPLPTAGAGQTVLKEVSTFQVRGWIPGLGWSALDTTESRRPATGLEVTIERKYKGVPETYRKVVLLP